MRQYLQIPKVQIVLILLVFLLLQTSLLGITTVLSLFLLCVGSTVVSDLLFAYLRRRILFTKPFAAIVTGLILTLIIDPQAIWYQIVAIGAFAMATKNFVRFSRHIFNPAASGLFLGWVFFKLNASWWAATLQRGEHSLFFTIGIYIVLFLVAMVSLVRFRKYYCVATYIIVYAVLSVFLFSSSLPSVIQTAISPGVLFFALLMLPEPMTSPVRKLRQVLYGLTVAVLQLVMIVMVNRFVITNSPDFSILALLLGNLLFFKYR